MLEDARKLIDLKVENDDVLALCYLQPGPWPRSRAFKLCSCRPHTTMTPPYMTVLADGTFEAINISTFETEKPE